MEFRRYGLTGNIYQNRGFTFIELMVVIGIFGLILLMTIPNYHALQENIAVKNNSYEIVNALRIAQNRSMTSQGGEGHGVHFGTSTYVIFEGSWASSTRKSEFQLVKGIKIFNGANTEINFNKLTGGTSSTTISVGSSDENKKKIEIDKAGSIKISQ